MGKVLSFIDCIIFKRLDFIFYFFSPAGPRLEGTDSGYDFTVDYETFSWIAALKSLSCAIFSIPVGILMDKIGRKRTMLLMFIPFLIGESFMIWATDEIYMIVGRSILGVCLAATYVLVPQYTGL
jgi:MFS family permease